MCNPYFHEGHSSPDRRYSEYQLHHYSIQQLKSMAIKGNTTISDAALPAEAKLLPSFASCGQILKPQFVPRTQTPHSIFQHPPLVRQNPAYFVSVLLRCEVKDYMTTACNIKSEPRPTRVPTGSFCLHVCIPTFAKNSCACCTRDAAINSRVDAALLAGALSCAREFVGLGGGILASLVPRHFRTVSCFSSNSRSL